MVLAKEARQEQHLQMGKELSYIQARAPHHAADVLACVTCMCHAHTPHMCRLAAVARGSEKDTKTGCAHQAATDKAGHRN